MQPNATTILGRGADGMSWHGNHYLYHNVLISATGQFAAKLQQDDLDLRCKQSSVNRALLLQVAVAN